MFIWQTLIMKNKLTLSHACSKYGAQMGRPNTLPFQYMGTNALPIKLQMERLQWVDGDYDQNGCYWGYTNGTDIYCAWNSEAEAQVFVRASNRQNAKELVREHFPKARFFN
jgi:hypothetical protein